MTNYLPTSQLFDTAVEGAESMLSLLFFADEISESVYIG